MSVAACAGDEGGKSAFASGPQETSVASTTGGASTSTGSTSTSTTSTTTADSGETVGSETGVSSSEPMLDVGNMPDFGSAPPEGCKGKIDFLFLISRDGTM
ncbi:MAG TPA: hypothetical protein VIK91_17675, partial [Nannocystis sp.]